jgi:hypothetical protein
MRAPYLHSVIHETLNLIILMDSRPETSFLTIPIQQQNKLYPVNVLIGRVIVIVFAVDSN